MGKVKKLRQKVSNVNKQQQNEVTFQTVSNDNNPIDSKVLSDFKFNFAKLSDLSYDRLVNENFEPAPKLVKTPMLVKTISKKDKMKNKRQNLLKKIDNVVKATQEAKEKKRREKTVITGDLRPLLDTLPSLESLMKLKPTPSQIKTGLGIDKPVKNKVHTTMTTSSNTLSKTTKKQIKKQKIKKLAKEYKQRFNHFQQVLTNADFRRNPREAIAAHIQMINAEGGTIDSGSLSAEKFKQKRKMDQQLKRQEKISMNILSSKLDDKFKQRRK